MTRLTLSVRNMASNLVGWVVPVALNVVAVPLLLHRLGPDAYGLSNLVMVLIGYFSILDMGMDIAGIKLLAEYNALRDSGSISRLMSTKLVMYSGAGLAGMISAFLVSDVLVSRVFSIPPALRSDAVLVFRLAAVGILANMLVAWSTTAPQGLQRYDVLNGLTVAVSFVSTAAGLAVVLCGYGVVAFVLVRVATNLVAAVGGFLMVHRLLPGLRLRFRIDRQMLRNIFSITVFGFIIKIAGMLAGSVDRTLIGVWAGTAAVAAYSVPLLVTTYLNQITLRMMNFIFPMSSEMLHLGQMVELRTIFVKTSKFCVAVNSIVLLPLMVLADRFLTLWVGPTLALESTSTFRVLLLACYVSSMVTLFSHILVGIGHVKPFTLFFVVRTTFMVFMCVLLIRAAGILGAGLAVLSASLLDIGFGAFSLRAYLKIPIRRLFGSYVGPFCLGVAAACLALIARPWVRSLPTLAAVMAACGSAYVALSFCTGVFGPAERQAIRSVPKALFGRSRGLT